MTQAIMRGGRLVEIEWGRNVIGIFNSDEGQNSQKLDPIYQAIPLIFYSYN